MTGDPDSPTRAGRSRTRRAGPRRTGYLVLTLLLVVAGGTAAALAGVPATEALGGALLAWIIQAASFWKLWPVLRSGRSAVRPWVAGMAARLAGLAVVAGAAAASPLSGRVLVIAYVAAVLPLLWIEGVWLARGSRTPGWGTTGESGRTPGTKVKKKPESAGRTNRTGRDRGRNAIRDGQR